MAMVPHFPFSFLGDFFSRLVFHRTSVLGNKILLKKKQQKTEVNQYPLLGVSIHLPSGAGLSAAVLKL